MNDRIVECDFHVEACQNRKMRTEKEDAYKIYINFYSDEAKAHLVSKRKLTITKEPQTTTLLGDPVYDIYSYNGVSTSKTAQLLNEKNFSLKTIHECASTIAVFNALQQNVAVACQILFVLDIKNFPKGIDDRSYTNKRSIETSENKILNFLRGDNTGSSLQAREFRSLLSSSSLSYVLLEGGLKAAVIEDHFLSEAEKNFLQTKGTGCQSFCQIIEFFLNAFKRGEEVTLKTQIPHSETVEKRTFNRAPYLKKINEDNPDYQPTNRSHTIYPRAYYEIATQGIYTSSMRSSTFFHTTIIERENQVVEMITVKKDEILP